MGLKKSEKFRPSKAGQPEADNLPQGIFNNNHVRVFVKCDFCGKIRCIYSMNALKKEQIFALQLKINENDFTCRIEEWIPLSHELKGIVFIRQSLSCDSPIESGYYSNRLKNLLFVIIVVKIIHWWRQVMIYIMDINLYICFVLIV